MIRPASPLTLTRVTWLLVGILVGALLSSPVSAQAAQRMFASLTSQLASGRSTPILCTANGTGCYLQVQAH